MSWIELSRNIIKSSLKKHRCVWCGEDIEKRSPYLKSCGTMDGEFQSNPYHLECNKAAMKDYDFMENDNMFEAYSFKRGTAEHK